MKKLGIMIALLLTAGSAFAGDFEQAQNAGFDSTKGPAALIALVLMAVGTVVWLWKNHKRTKLPIATTTTAIATMLSLHAGDFADAADRGYWRAQRWNGLVSGINAVGAANNSVYNYVQANPMQALGYVHAFGDTSSTSRITAGAMINAAGPYPSQIAVGPLSGAGYHYSTDLPGTKLPRGYGKAWRGPLLLSSVTPVTLDLSTGTMSEQYDRRKVCQAIMKADSEEEIEKILAENEKWAWMKYDGKMQLWEKKANKRRWQLGLPEKDYDGI